METEFKRQMRERNPERYQWLQKVSAEAERQQQQRQEMWEAQQRRCLEEQERRERESARIQEENRRIRESVTIFLDSQEEVFCDPLGVATTQELYQCYRQWCIGQKLPPKTVRSFSLRLAKWAQSHDLDASNHILDEEGIERRGYYGIRLREQK